MIVNEIITKVMVFGDPKKSKLQFDSGRWLGLGLGLGLGFKFGVGVGIRVRVGQ